MAQNRFKNFITHKNWQSFAAIATVLALLFAIFTWAVLNIKTLLPGNVSAISTSTTHPTRIPTKIPTIIGVTPSPTMDNLPASAILYQADFSKGDQGWLTYAHSSQWSYNANDKALESNGSLYCCNSASLSTIIIVTPYTMTRSDFTIEARIRVTGINKSHPYTESDPDQKPFFGLYVRGDASNQEGYKAGINGLLTGEPNAGAYSSFLTFGPTIPGGKKFRDKNTGGKDYALDNNWHTYRLDVKGDTFMLLIDGKPMYSAPIQDDYFPSGPHLGIEDYDFYLQVQNFTVVSL